MMGAAATMAGHGGWRSEPSAWSAAVADGGALERSS